MVVSNQIYILVIAEGEPTPPELLDVVRAGQDVFYGGMWIPQTAHYSATVIVDRIA